MSEMGYLGASVMRSASGIQRRDNTNWLSVATNAASKGQSFGKVPALERR